MNNLDFAVHYKKPDGTFRVWYSKTDEIITLNRMPNNISQFYMTRGYEPTDKDLRKYAKDLYDATQEMKTSKIMTFDYIEPKLYFFPLE